MRRHAKGLAIYLVASLLLVVVAIYLKVLWLAVAVLLSAPVMGAILATAFMRARGHSPEHHPPIDRHLHDTRP